MKKLLALVAVMAVISVTSYAQAAVIWDENFSDVSDWVIGYDPSGGSTLTSDGSLGSLYVNGGATEAAFVPNTSVKPFVAFNPAEKSQYTLDFIIDSLTSSTSYDVALDLFASDYSYFATVWNTFPASGTSTATGSQSVNLGGFTFGGSTAYLMPKVSVHTGDAGQTVKLDNMSFDYTPIPEPASLLLLGSGLLGLIGVSRKRK